MGGDVSNVFGGSCVSSVGEGGGYLCLGWWCLNFLLVGRVGVSQLFVWVGRVVVYEGLCGWWGAIVSQVLVRW